MGVHIRRQKDTEIHRGEDDVKKTETEIGGMQPQAQESQDTGRGKGGFSPEALESVTCWHTKPIVASRARREYNSVVLSHQV